MIRYSKHGGMKLPEIMSKHPEDLKSIYVDFKNNLSMRDLMDIATNLGVDQQKSLMTFIVKHMYDLFVERDINVIEINPLVLTADNDLVVNHAKIKIDENSYYRQQELMMTRDLSQMNTQERIGLLG